MRRIAFRRVLPIIQLALFLALFLVVDQKQKAIQAEREARPPVKVDNNSVVLDMSDFYVPSLAEEVCFGLNFPAGLAALLLWATSRKLVGERAAALLGDTNSAFLIVSWSLALLVQWYLVGLWLDRLVGSVPTPQRRPNAFSRILTRLTLAITGLISTLLAVRALIDGGHISKVSLVLMASWFAFFAVACAREIRRWKHLAQP